MGDKAPRAPRPSGTSSASDGARPSSAQHGGKTSDGTNRQGAIVQSRKAGGAWGGSRPGTAPATRAQPTESPAERAVPGGRWSGTAATSQQVGQLRILQNPGAAGGGNVRQAVATRGGAVSSSSSGKPAKARAARSDVPEAAATTGEGRRGAPPQKWDRSSHNVRPDAPSLFAASDLQAFPSLDGASTPALKGSWAKPAQSSAGSWSSPLAAAVAQAGTAKGQEQNSDARRAEEEQWVTVAQKTKGAPAKAGAPARGAWGTKPPAMSLKASSAAKGSLGVPNSAGQAASGPAQAEAKKTSNRKSAITLMDLMPVLQKKKDVKMPAPYTSKTVPEKDGGRSNNKTHSKNANLVRNPNAADGQSMVVLHRKEKEGGKKKTKISPLKKLILRDRRERLEAAAAAEAAPASSTAALPVAEQEAVDLGQEEGSIRDAASAAPDVAVSNLLDRDQDQFAADASAGATMPVAEQGWMAEETSQLAVEWLTSRGMDASNPSHVQLLINSLNAEPDEEGEEDEESEEEDGEQEELVPQGKRVWSQLPSAVTWVHSLGHNTTATHAQQTAATASSRAPVSAGNIPQWAHIDAPEFCPGGSVALASGSLSTAAMDQSGSLPGRVRAPDKDPSSAVSAGWAEALDESNKGTTTPSLKKANIQPSSARGIANESSKRAKSPKKQDHAKAAAGGGSKDGGGGLDGGAAGAQSEGPVREGAAAAQGGKSIKISTASVNPGDGKNNKMLVRDYCDQKLDENLNVLVDGFLRKLNQLQERLRERDAMKAKMKRRLQSGLREVHRSVRTQEARVVFVAPNIEPSPSEGGLDDKVEEIIKTARSFGVPVIFCLSRSRLGKALGKSMRMSACSVLMVDGVYEQFQEILALAATLRDPAKK